MKKILLLSFSLCVVSQSYAVNLDQGVPENGSLWSAGYVERDVKGLDRSVQEIEGRIDELSRTFSKDAPPEELDDVVGQDNINKINLGHVFSIDELEIKDNLINREGEILRHGFVKTFYENVDSETRLIREIIEVNGGYVEGEIREYSLGGRLSQKYSYIDNKKEGEAVLYKADGSVLKKTTYKGGKKDGLCVLYGGNGFPLFEVVYKKNIVSGYIKEYYPNGGLKTYSQYLKNVKNGIEVSYNMKGEKVHEATYKDGVLEGVYTEFYPTRGTKKSETVYVEGKGVSKSEFYPDGRVRGVFSLIAKKEAEEVSLPKREYSDEYLILEASKIK